MMTALIAHAMCAMMPRAGAEPGLDPAGYRPGLSRASTLPGLSRASTLPGLSRADAKTFTNNARRESDWLYFSGLVLGTLTFVITPVLTLGLPLPSFVLSSKLLDKHAQRIVAHRSYWLKQAVFLVRLNAGMAWGALPKSRAAMALAPYPTDPGTFVGDGKSVRGDRL